jgi:hypothetical protein
LQLQICRNEHSPGFKAQSANTAVIADCWISIAGGRVLDEELLQNAFHATRIGSSADRDSLISMRTASLCPAVALKMKLPNERLTSTHAPRISLEYFRKFQIMPLSDVAIIQ